jgi:8-oxo-dGTP pyrophosphatase MutT (NUDIX family)
VTDARVRLVDVYVVRRGAAGLEVLVLRRSASVRCPGSWEAVHGHIEPGETPVAAALRELEEETGLSAARLYNLSRVESFYLHRTDEVALAPAFAALVPPGEPVRLSAEHDAFDWPTLEQAVTRFAWPRERRAVTDLQLLLGRGDAGVLEDVLSVFPGPPPPPA